MGLEDGLPMYQPWAKTMRRVNMRKITPVPAHLYATKGTALSR